MSRLAAAALVALLALALVPAPSSGVGGCEDGPPGTKSDGPGHLTVTGMTTPPIRTTATPSGTYFVVDSIAHRIERWTESNGMAGLQRFDDCAVTSHAASADTLEEHVTY